MNKVLVLVDCQNDFIDGALRNEEAIKKVPNIVKYINEFDGKYIITTMDTHFNDYQNTFEGKRLPVTHCIHGSDGWKLNKDIEKAISDKNIFRDNVIKCSFGSVDLFPNALHHANEIEPIDEIVFAGFCTDICVMSNVLIARAHYPSVKITVLKDCCAGVTPEKHEAALNVMQSCQIDVE